MATITEDLTAQVDGVQDTFSTLGGPFISGTLVVFKNGLRLRAGTIVGGEDFEELDLETFQICAPPLAGDTLHVQYESAFSGLVVSGSDPTC